MGRRVYEESVFKLINGNKAKASVNSAYLFFSYDPKLSDLFMNRLKAGEQPGGGPN